MRTRDEYFTRSFRLDLATASAYDRTVLAWLRAAARTVVHFANAAATLEFVRRQLHGDDGAAAVLAAERRLATRACGAYVSSYVTDAVSQAVRATFAGDHGAQLRRGERSVATFTSASVLRVRLDKVKTLPLALDGSYVILRARVFAPGPLDIRCTPGRLIDARTGEPGTDGYALVLRRLLNGEYPIRGAQFLLGGIKPALRIMYQLPGLPHETGGTAVLSDHMVLSYGERHTSFRPDCEELARRLHVLTIRRVRFARQRRKRRVSGRGTRACPSAVERGLVTKGDGMRRTVTQQMAAAIVRAAGSATTLILPSVEQWRSAFPLLEMPWTQLRQAIESHATIRGIQCPQTLSDNKQKSTLRVRRLMTTARRLQNRGLRKQIQAAI